MSGWITSLPGQYTRIAIVLFIHSTFILSIALMSVYLLSRLGKSAHIQSWVLRISFIAIFVSPCLQYIAAPYIDIPFKITVPGENHQAAETDNVAHPATPQASQIPEKSTQQTSTDNFTRKPGRHPVTTTTGSASQHRSTVPSPVNSTISGKPITALENSPQPHRPPYIMLRSIASICIAAWTFMSILLVIRMISAFVYLIYHELTSHPASRQVMDSCNTLAGILEIKTPRVLYHDNIRCTFTWGHFRPVILIPSVEHRIAMNTQEVLLHEIAHIRRHDFLWNLLAQLALIMIPTHPLMWLCAYRLELANDYACDDAVIAYAGTKSYARQLYDIAKTIQRRPHVTVAASFAGSGSTLRKRIRRIFDSCVTRRGSLLLHETLSVAGIFLCSLSLSMMVGVRIHNAEAGPRLTGTNIGTSSLDHGITPKILPDIRNRISNPVESRSDNQAIKKIDTVTDKFPEQTAAKNPEIEDIGKPSAPDTDYTSDNSGITADKTIVGKAHRDDHPPVLPDTSTLPEPESDIAPDSIEIIADRAPVQSAQITDRSPILSHLVSRENVAVFKHIPVDVPGNQGDSDPDDIDGQRIESLYLSLGKDKLNPIWAPDGESITFNDKYYGIWSISSDGGVPELIFDNYFLIKYKEYFIHPGGLEVLGYTHDSNSLIFRRYIIDEERGSSVIINDLHTPYNATIINPIPIIERLDIQTGTRTRLANEASVCDISASGQYFVWITQTVNETPRLMVRNESTSEEWSVDAGNPSKVKFCADEETIVYQDGPCIYRCDIQGGDPEPLTGNAVYKLFDVSPDGSWLLLGSDDNARLAALHIESGVVLDIMPDGLVAVSSGTFSPDGSLLCVNAKTSRLPDSTWEMHLIQLSLEDPATDASEEDSPRQFSIRGPFPNPFNAATRIEFNTATDGPVIMDIYNVLGQKVATLVDEPMQAGAHSTVWDGRDSDGRHISSGMYIAQISSPDGMKTLRMTLVK